MNSSGKATLEIFLERARPLYTLPAVAVDVLTLVDDPRTEAPQLKACIERDPALTAKLLRVVNSSLYSPARPVADVAQAVALLGMRAVKLLALGFCLPERMFDQKTSRAMGHYWRRTLLRAVAARELAGAVRWKEGDEAFVAALLADVGVAVLLQEVTEDYLPLYEGARLGDFEPLEAERLVFKFDRLQLTRRLLKEWRLPGSLTATIEAARDGGDVRVALPPAARLVYVAELLTAVVLDERLDLWPALSEGAERHLRLSADALTELGAAIEAKAGELAGAFIVTMPADGTVRDVLDRAGRLMPGAAEAAVADLIARRPPTANSLPPRTAGRSATAEAAGPRVVDQIVPERDLAELYDQLRAAATVCRGDRAPLSLCLLELGDGEQALPAETVVAACRAVEWPGAVCLALGPTRAALVLPDCDRRRALDVFDELRLYFRRERGDDDTTGKLSAGIAVVGLPPRDFPVAEPTAAAERCLNAARSAAGDAAKSIEMY